MRILIVHNHYIDRGGEDAVFDAEKNLLKQHGHDVFTFEMDNLDISSLNKLKLIFNTIWSHSSQTKLKKYIKLLNPDIIHVHNTFPLISPAIFWTASFLSIPVVHTLHNFRIFCIQAMFLRDGDICELCLNGLPINGIRYKCYRNSYFLSALVVTMLIFHKMIGTFKRKITCYIALNDFCYNKFINGNISPSRLSIKPNFVDIEEPLHKKKSGAAYVGRLSPEKGIKFLLSAHSIAKTDPFHIVGDGPLKELVLSCDNLIYEGYCNPDKIYKIMAKSLYIILPSIWYENMPRTLVESFANGTAVIASRIGALENLVKDKVTGLLFDPGSFEDLSEKLIWANDHPDLMCKMGKNARLIYEKHFTSDINYKSLLSIYKKAIIN